MLVMTKSMDDPYIAGEDDELVDELAEQVLDNLIEQHPEVIQSQINLGLQMALEQLRAELQR